jgi:ubiquinone/menaquinone biosynthesis C-methylase UbiE
VSGRKEERVIEEGRARETYTHGHGKFMARVLSRRTAAIDAGFLLPHLRPGATVLDCGCGPGSITVGMAEAVAPGRTVGIDLSDGHFPVARALAVERGVDNVVFQVADVYQLPFDDGSFDAVFANGLLLHLSEPRHALRELRRVLRPSGIVGIRDLDWGSWLMAPTTPRLEEFRALLRQVMTSNGASLEYARHQRALLLQAGFARTEVSVTASCHVGGTYRSTAEATEQWAETYLWLLEDFAQQAEAAGWIDPAGLEAMAAEMQHWANRPDAFEAILWCEALGWASV